VSRLRFWGSAVLVALLFALASAFLLPYGWLGLETEALRWRAWLLTLWTGGVMSVLFGLAGMLGYRLPPGIREVVDAGSVRAALEERKRAREAGEKGNFASWLVVTGLFMIGIYFVAWQLLRGLPV
jgi:hypothetical protein